MVESSSFAGHMANVILGLVLLLIAFCSIVPMWHVLMASISEGRDLFAKDGLVLLPVGGLNFEGYKLVFSDPSILRSYAVTVFYVVGTAGLGLLLNVLGGYVLSQNSRLKPFFVADSVLYRQQQVRAGRVSLSHHHSRVYQCHGGDYVYECFLTGSPGNRGGGEDGWRRTFASDVSGNASAGKRAYHGDGY